MSNPERTDGLYTTGDMARLTGNTVRTVRFYEEAGVLRPDRRSAGGHRLFGRRELDRLQFISDMREAGLSLEAIRALLELKASADDGQQASAAAIAALDEQIGTLDEKIEVLSRLRGELARAREILSGCRSCTNERCFPDACDECEVMTAQSDVPTSVKALWSLRDTES